MNNLNLQGLVDQGLTDLISLPFLVNPAYKQEVAGNQTLILTIKEPTFLGSEEIFDFI